MFESNHPERQKLLTQIKEWNMNRLDLFEISEPNEYLEFYGVMRFFYQGDDLKYQSKCLRVSNTATTRDLIDALIMKFHPDLKMLGNDKYTLYECHNLQERKLKENEHPLVVQLYWATDDRDGKFILKNETRQRRRSTDLSNHALLSNYGMSKSTSALANGYDNQTLRSQSSAVYSSATGATGEPATGSGPLNFIARRFSSSKKSRRKSRDHSMPTGSSGSGGGGNNEEAKRQADEMAGKLPESSFTRTISNPDEVMKRRRQKKLESRLEQFSGARGGNETGGTLKIYGDSINPDIPYKTLLLSVNDTADRVLAETLDKYGLSHEDQRCYVLIQQNIPPRDSRHRNDCTPVEIVLHDQDCPLGILVNCPPRHGYATFAIRRRAPMDKYPAKPRVPPIAVSSNGTTPQHTGSKDRSRTTSNSNIINTATAVSNPAAPAVLSVHQPDKEIEFPRLVACIADEEGNMFEDKSQTFSLIALVRSQQSRIPSDGVKFIKIGSQSSAIGGSPNILLPLTMYPDIRPTHCHISAKRDPSSGGEDSARTLLQLLPTLDSSCSSPRPCIVYVNEIKIETATRLRNEDYVQLGEHVMFKFEEFGEEEQTNGRIAGNVLLEHMREQGSVDAIQMDYLTADLPVSVQYEYSSSSELARRVFSYARGYADRGSHELFAEAPGVEHEFDMDSPFRLTTAYMLYLVLRAGLGDERHAGNIMEAVVHGIDQVIQEDKCNVEKQVFWLSNASELLHLIQCDNDLRNYANQCQDVLIAAVEASFSFVQNQFSQDLMLMLPNFLDENDNDLNDDTAEDGSPCLDRASTLVASGQSQLSQPVQHLLQTLSLAHALFGNCQLNVALSIQMFSQLFHLINAWLGNSVLGDPSLSTDGPVPVTRQWGNRLQRRLNRIRDWGHVNGLEMAAACHMQQMHQIAELMATDKTDLSVFGNKCMDWMNINASQLSQLLYNCEDYSLPEGWIEVVTNSVLEAFRGHRRETFSYQQSATTPEESPQLYEDLDLRLPLLLPADGFCCDRNIVCSSPRELTVLLDQLHTKQDMQFRLNPPSTPSHQGDTRWRAYLGAYENTPSVSRSGTIVDQVPGSPHRPMEATVTTAATVKINNPRTVAPQAVSSFDSDESNSANDSELDEIDVGGGNSNSEVFHGDLSSRYKLKLKKINNSLGLSIIATKSQGRGPFRIYVKDVISGGAGDRSGKIRPGDQVVSVDDHPMVDIMQDAAVDLMKRTGNVVSVVMERGAADRHGVSDILNQARSMAAAKSRVSAPIQLKPSTKSILASANHVEKPVTKSSRRTELTLPPLPQGQDKSAPRPHRVSASHSTSHHKPVGPVSKHHVTTKAAAKPHSNSRHNNTATDYNSLPVRNKQPRQETVEPLTHKYPTSRTSKPQSRNHRLSATPDQPIRNTQSNSQPDLTKVVMPSFTKRGTVSETESSGSTGSSASSSGSESSEEYQPPLPVKASQVPPTEPPKEHRKLSDQASSVKISNTTKAQVPKFKVPPKEAPVTNVRVSTNGKGKFLNRPELKASSSENDEELSLEKTPRPPVKQLNPPKIPVAIASDSVSASESESGSSYTESTSSDQSPRPATIPQKQQPQKVHARPILAPEPPAPKHTTYTQPPPPQPVQLSPKTSHTVNKYAPQDPQHDINKQSPSYKKRTSIDQPVKEEVPMFSLPQKLELQFSSDNSEEREPSSLPLPSPVQRRPVEVAPVPKEQNPTPIIVNTPKTPISRFVPPPRPTASHPQYHPPSQLEENESYSMSPNPSVNAESFPGKSDVRLRRQRPSLDLQEPNPQQPPQLRQLPTISSPPPPRPAPSPDKNESPVANRSSKILYGRPQFHNEGQSSRPVSLYRPPGHTIDPENEVSIVSDRSSAHISTGIVIPASPPHNVLGSHEVYRESHIKKPKTNSSKAKEEPAETLSFRDKMKMFAQKNGEEDVTERAKFSSKQRRIESGIYN